MSGSDEPPFGRFLKLIGSVIDGPVTFVREKVVEPIQGEKKHYYYHEQFRRVPTIDECRIGDNVCIFEANEQYKRDRSVDENIVNILRQRRIECEFYHGHQAPEQCKKAKEDYIEAETNLFTKYGDLGTVYDARNAYMKQKHRMLWERRHGPVGTGMKTKHMVE